LADGTAGGETIVLHFFAFTFFAVVLLVASTGFGLILYGSRRAILSALQVPVPAAALPSPGVSRVRIRYVSSSRRVTPSLRAVA
jgi:hypothetical protein